MKVTSSLPETGALAQLTVIRALAAKAGVGTSAVIAEELGASPRVKRILRSPVPALDTSSPEELNDSRVVMSAFVSLLRHSSAFYKMWADRMLVRGSYNTRIGLTTLAATGFVVGEGEAVPLSSLDIGVVDLEPRTAVGIVVATLTLLRSEYAQPAIERELKRAIVSTVDSDFLSMMAADAPTLQAQTDDVITDLRALVELVEPTSESKLLLVTTPALVRALTAETSLGGAPMFPNMTVAGGFAWGVPVHASDEIDEGTAMVLDGSRIVANADQIETDVAASATLQMLSDSLTQNSVTSDASTTVSMFQTNSVAIKVSARFGATKVADNAAAVLVGALWGGALPVS